MSFREVEEFANLLPYALKEQVLGYARSVRDAIPEIVLEAGVECSSEVTDKIIYIAGLRKLYSICNSSYLAIENTSYLLQESNVNNVLVGGTDMSKGSKFYNDLNSIKKEIDKYLIDNGIKKEIVSLSYCDLIRMYVHGRNTDK